MTGKEAAKKWLEEQEQKRRSTQPTDPASEAQRWLQDQNYKSQTRTNTTTSTKKKPMGETRRSTMVSSSNNANASGYTSGLLDAGIRRKKYQDNIDRIAEIDKEISNIRGSYITTPSANPWEANNAIVFDTGKEYKNVRTEEELLKERKLLEQENRVYKRDGMQADNNILLRSQNDFEANSKAQNYGTPTREQLAEYDAQKQTEYQINKDGNLVDANGNVFDKNSVQAKPEVNDKLGLYLASSDEERQEAYNNGSNFAEQTWANIIKEGDAASWNKLRDEDIAIYYYLLNTKGQEKANEWLDNMRTELNRREYEQSVESFAKKYDEANGLQKVWWNALSVPANVYGGALSAVSDLGYILRGEEINPYDTARFFQDYAQIIRENTAENINEKTNNINVLGMGAGDVYQALMSGADSMYGSTLGGTAYGVLMGAGAASSTVRDLYERGATQEQMVTGGILAGVAEMIFEKYSIDKFVNLKEAKSLKDIVINGLKQGGIEASEEALTEIANIFSDTIIMGNQSNIVASAEKFMAEGDSKSQAYAKAIAEAGLDVLKAGVSGLISGGAMGGVSSSVNAVSSAGDVKRLGEFIKEGDTSSQDKTSPQYDKLMELAKEVEGVNNLVKRTERNATDRNVGLLANEVAYQVKKNGPSEIQDRLEKAGIDKSDAKVMAKAMSEVSEGIELPDDVARMIEKSDAASQIYTDIILDENSKYNQRRASLMDMGAMEYGYTGDNNQIAKMTQNIGTVEDINTRLKANNTPTAPIVETNTATPAEDSYAILEQYAKDRAVAEIEQERNQAIADAENIRPVLAKRFGEEIAEDIVQQYSSDISPIDFAIGISEGYNYGWGHIPKNSRTSKEFNMLSAEQQQYAIQLGEKARASQDNKLTENAQAKAKPMAKKYGAEVKSAKIHTQRADVSVKALNNIAKALKVNIVIEDMNNNSNGYYDPKTNSIHVDSNAGGNYSLLFTASHELVHYIRNWNASKFTTLADFLMEQYARKGVDVSELIKNEQNKAYNATNGKVNMSYEDAYEEVVAQAMQRFLTDSDFIAKLNTLQQKDATLVQRIINKLKQILEAVRDAYAGLTTSDKASQYVKEMGKEADRLYALMEDALISASEASYTIGPINMAEFAEAKTPDGHQLFQYKAMEADEDTYRKMLKKHGVSEADINTLFTTVNKAMDIIKDNLEVLDYAWESDIDDRSFMPVKPNSDKLYKVSVDFSTLCRKRLIQQSIAAELQRVLEKPLSREESIAIRDELMKIQEEGRQIEIACALCYVESARMKSPTQIKKFLANRESLLKEFFASKSGGSIKQAVKDAETKIRAELNAGDTPLKYLPDSIAKQIRAAKKEARASYKPTAEEENLISVAENMTIDDFTTPDGLANMTKNYPVLFDAYTSYIRNATKSKGLEGDTWWRAGDSSSISDTLIANMNKENGLRSQSWSDFQVIHLLDYIAATIELSTRNAKEQVYSKVPDFIDLMGKTNAMLNMSLIPSAKFNGILEYDSTEGMDYRTALKLRDKYPSTAGTICIGVNNKQIQLLLEDKNIDYVIPYHKSGMSAQVRKMMHMPNWENYENDQNERKLSTSEAKAQADRYGVTLVDNNNSTYQKAPVFSEWFNLDEANIIAKQENEFPSNKQMANKYGEMYGGYMAMQNAANNYIKLCAERGLAPKFSTAKADFTSDANYWKLLIDRKMINNATGEIIEQKEIQPIFEESEVLRILNDEIERYPNVKKDQDYAIRKVTEKFLSGEMNSKLDKDTVAKIMQKPVDNITTTNIIASEEGVKYQYDFSKTFEEQVDDFKAGVFPVYDTLIVCTTPKVFRGIGLNPLPMTYTQSHLRDALANKDGDHLGEALIKKLPQALQSPVAIIDSDSQNGRLVAIIEIQGQIRNTIAAVEIDGTGSMYGNLIDTNVILTAHSRDNAISKLLKNAVSSELAGSGGLYYWQKNKAIQLLNTTGVQFPGLSNIADGFVRSITDPLSNVKQKYSSVTETEQFKRWFEDKQKSPKDASKVVNKDGTPRLVYHYTNSEFWEFDTAKSGSNQGQTHGDGIYISTNPYDFSYAGKNKMELYANIRKPFEMKLTNKQATYVLEKYASTKHDLDKYHGLYRNHAMEKLTSPTRVFDYLSEYAADNGIKVSDILKDLGYDGVHDGSIWVAFDSTQLKSATDNIGTFDASNPDIRYQYKDEDSLDNRTLLANALNETATTEKEKALLSEYKKKANALNAEEARLAEIRKEIHELKFTKGKYDKAKIAKLTNEGNEIVKKIDRYDKRLLQLEAAAPLKRVLESEKKKAYARQKTKAKEQHANYRTGLQQTEVKNKIRNDIKQLSAILNRGTKERNTKNELRETAATSLRLSELLFSDKTDADIYRSGKMRIANDVEKKAYESYGKYLDRIASINESLKELRAYKGRVFTQEEIERKNTLTAKRNELYKMLDVAAKPLKDEFEKARIEIESQTANEITNALTELIDAYESIKDRENPQYIRDAYDSAVVDKLTAIRDKMKGKTIGKMSLKELESIHDAYKLVMHTITYANKLMRDGKAEDAQKTAESIMDELKKYYNSNKTESAAIVDKIKKLGFDELKPIYAFEVIGANTLTELFKDMERGESTYGADIRDADAFIKNLIEKYKYDKLNAKKTQQITLAEGQTVELTVPQMMSIYAYSKRDQAIKHMENGGFVFADKEFKKQGKLLKQIHNQYSAIRMGKADVDIIKAAMGKDMVDFVDKAQAYLTDVMAEKGNSVSKILYGIDLFKENIYFPIKTASEFMFQTNTPAGEISLKSSGMTKETIPEASNPLVLDDFMDVWSEHVNRMSVYHSFVIPIENFNKAYNYSVYRTEKESVSVKTALKSIYGGGVTQYISKLIRDINGGVQSESSAFGKLVGNFKKTAVAMSSSVVIQQPTAVIRATALIDLKYFKSNDKMKHSDKWEQLKQYAPIAVIKEMGGYDIGGGRQAMQYFTNIQYDKGERLKGLFSDSNYRDEWFMRAAAYADEVGWGIIWDACKNEIAATTNLQGEELLKKAGERFTEVVQYTQVYDSTLSRSGYMRSQSEITKMATSFMGEPTTSINMMVNAVIQSARHNISAKQTARIISATLASMLMANILKSFVGALRDDDEDESYLEKYAQSLSANLKNEFMYGGLNALPFVRDIISIFAGYDVERTDMALIADTVKAIKDLWDEDKTSYYKIKELVGAVANLFGLPIRNVVREFESVVNGIKMILDDTPMGNFGEGFVEGFTGKQTTFNIALDKGNFERANELISSKLDDDTKKYIQQGMSKDKAKKEAKSNIRASLTNYWKPLYLEAHKKKDTEEMRRIRRILLRTKMYDGDIVEICRKWVSDSKK